MHKIRLAGKVGWGLFLAAAGWVTPALGQAGVVSGRLLLRDQGDRPAADVGQAVIWLTGSEAPAAVPRSVEMATEGKQFVPHLLVVPRGSTVLFPNHDPFNHNVFSLSPTAKFDLGLYGRGELHGVDVPDAGVVRVYCNVHAQMRGLVLVHETALVAQPGADGTFRVEGVPPGEYQLHLWHERATPVTQTIRVPAAGLHDLAVTLDARGYRLVQHRDKNGRSYSDRSRRY